MLKIHFSAFKHNFFTLLCCSSLLIFSLTSCACTDNRKPEARKDEDKNLAALDTYNQQTAVNQAFAEIKPLKGDQIRGRFTFTKTNEGIRIVGDVDGLTPGEHGFHVHEHGDCSGDGSAVGSHFNPTNSKHGGPDSVERHVGDLGNLVVDQNGHAHYDRVDKFIALEGQNSILGRSIIIHADRDDYTTQPTGASGDKIACGLIEILQETH